MGQWKRYRLGDIVEIKGGKRLPKGHEYSSQTTGFPYLRVVDFKGKSIDLNNLKYLEKETSEAISRYIISKDDVYISIAGTIGLVGTVPESLDGANLTENAAKLVIKDKTLIDKEYLVEYLSSNQGKQQIEKQTITTSQPKLSLFRMEEIVIPIPSISNQRKVVELLSKSQKLIDTRKEQIKACDELIKSQFIEMFGDPVTNPKGWETYSFEEVFDISSSKRILKSEWKSSGIPFLRVRDMVQLATSGAVDNEFFVSEEFYASLTDSDGIPSPGDILVSATSTLGKCHVVKQGERFYFKDADVLRFRAKKPINPYYFTELMKTPYIINQIQRTLGVTTVSHFTIKSSKTINLRYPNIELQNQFVSFVQQVDKLKFKMEQSLVELENNFNSLMQRAFKGELF